MMLVTACEHRVCRVTATERTAKVKEHAVLHCWETEQEHWTVMVPPS